MRIAVIGSRISGLLAARLLAGDQDVHVLEANDYAGGHTKTTDVGSSGDPAVSTPGSCSSTIEPIPALFACCGAQYS